MLNLIAGLEHVTGGHIFIGDRPVQDVPPKDRGIAMVFQNYALYPHMTVAQNIGYALKVAGMARPERDRRIAEAARIVDLDDYLERRPAQLSGGQRQRVAIARAVVREPGVMLFDEPLSNLDAKLRQGMRMELSDLHKRIGATSVFVTHDQAEAMTLADKIMILNKGTIEQYGTPDQIYHEPATTFVAGFIGAPAMNLIEVVADGPNLTLPSGDVIAEKKTNTDVIAGIRPEQVLIQSPGISARVRYREELGSHSVLVTELSDGQTLNVTTPMDVKTIAGEVVPLVLPEQRVKLFDKMTGRALTL